MSTTQTVPVTAQRAWGIGAVVVEVISVLPSAIALILALSVDANYGWLLIITIPVLVIGGLIGMLAGIVGIIFGVIRRRALVWPIVGTAVGVLVVILAAFVFVPFLG
ncbi:hypothetical protein [Microbacterium sp.]|uniref:hypothetical protein n=1 Tax=Microbacterium sp. TaxID=51671 RepID=UPI0037366035